MVGFLLLNLIVNARMCVSTSYACNEIKVLGNQQEFCGGSPRGEVQKCQNGACDLDIGLEIEVNVQRS